MSGDYTDMISRSTVTGGTTGDPLVPTPGPRRSPMAGISNEPWSGFSAADYDTPQSYASACLVNLNDGPPSKWTKAKCFLPVREPDGDLNRNAVHAAAARLAGAGGGVDIPPADKKAAARKLVSLYGQLNEQAPDSIRSLAS